MDVGIETTEEVVVNVDGIDLRGDESVAAEALISLIDSSNPSNNENEENNAAEGSVSGSENSIQPMEMEAGTDDAYPNELTQNVNDNVFDDYDGSILNYQSSDGNGNNSGEQTETSESEGNGVDAEQEVKAKRQKLISKMKKRSFGRELNAENRQHGLAYKGSTKEDGKRITVDREPRELGPSCTSAQCQKLRKCHVFTESERKEIFTSFWKLTLPEKKVYLQSMVDVVPAEPSRNVLLLNHQATRRLYHLKCKGTRQKVCQSFFLSTLGLKNGQMANWLDSSKETKQTPMQPARTSHVNVSREKEKQFIRDKLNELPRVPSHFCRAENDKEFLQSDFKSVREVHRFIQKEASKTSDIGAITWGTFHAVFKSMNLAVHQLRKDACDVCTSIRVELKHKNLTNEERQEVEKRLEEHIQAYKEALEEKKRDKKSGDRVAAWVCDLQKVFGLPHLTTNLQYYLSKIQVRNWTSYNLKKRDAICRVWEETQGCVDASDFASLWWYLIEEEVECDPEMEEFIGWSDGCCAQNRNAILANALLYLAMRHKIIITQKFLVHGHTFNEGDVTHSCIERVFQKTMFYSMEECAEEIKRSRIHSKSSSNAMEHPFKVHIMKYTDFINFKNINAYPSIRPGVGVGSTTVNNIRALQYLPSGRIMYKLKFKDDWQELPHKNPDPVFEITEKYTSRITIPRQKYQHLQRLKPFMPPEHHVFYDELPITR